jgi:uncharacterized protein (UPF0332 family)/predicted nucleotidyltransferase
MAKATKHPTAQGRPRPAPSPGDRPLLTQILEAVHSVEPHAQVILFGSRARGDATPESDWDLLILLDGSNDAGRQDAIRSRLFTLQLESAESITQIVHSRDEWESVLSQVDPFHANVEDDGIDLATMKPAPRCDPRRFTEAQMEEAGRELQREWMDRARTALAAAVALADEGLWGECVSRLYYACYHATRALLFSRGYRFSNHRGVQMLFNQHFAHTGLIPPDLAHLYNDLVEQRGKADYEPFVRFGESTVRPWIAEAERFIDVIAGLLSAADSR